jgi:hypothetical protein
VVGATVALAGSVLLLVVAGVVQSPAPHGTPFVSDPGAERDLVALVRAGDRARYLVEFTSTRVVAGGATRTETVTEGQVPPRRVVAGASSATVDLDDRRVRCTATDVGVECLPEDTDPDGLPAWRVYETAFAEGLYAARRLGSRAIAGEAAQCFELVAVDGVLPALGLVGERCLAADGVPLAARVATSTLDDRRVAVSVRRDVDADDLAALLDRLGPDPGADAVP